MDRKKTFYSFVITERSGRSPKLSSDNLLIFLSGQKLILLVSEVVRFCLISQNAEVFFLIHSQTKKYRLNYCLMIAQAINIQANT